MFLSAAIALAALLAGSSPAAAQTICDVSPRSSFNLKTRHCAQHNSIYAYVCPGLSGWYTSSYQIDFGDGTPVEQATYDPKGDTTKACYGVAHVYQAAGDYTIQVTSLQATCYTDTAQVVSLPDTTDTFTAVDADFDAKATLDVSYNESPFSIFAQVCVTTLLEGKSADGSVDFGDGSPAVGTGSLVDGSCTTVSHNYGSSGVFKVRATVGKLNDCGTVDIDSQTSREVTRTDDQDVVIGLVADFAMSPNPVPGGGLLTLQNLSQLAPGVTIDRVDFAITPDNTVPEVFDGTLDKGFFAPGGKATVTAPANDGNYFVHLKFFNNQFEIQEVVTKALAVRSCIPTAAPVASADKSNVAPGEGYRLSWAAVTNASGYRVIRFRDGTQVGSVATAGLFQDFATAADDAGHFYNHYVRALVACGAESESSAVVTVSVGCAAAAPLITSGTTVDGGNPYTLTWTGDLSTGSYAVFLADGGPEVQVATVPAGVAKSFQHPTSTNDVGKHLVFRVEARPSCGTAVSSATQTVEVISETCQTAPSSPAPAHMTADGGGPVTGSSFLDLTWAAVAQPVSNYHWMVNGGQEGDVPGGEPSPSAEASPVGLLGTITLSVQASNACGVSPVAMDTASNTPPTADFTWTVSGNQASFTDASTGSQATSWLWLFGDTTEPDDAHSPDPHPYAAAGAYTVWLIASNGAGSTAMSHVVTVGPPPAATAPLRVTLFARSGTRRQSLEGVRIDGPGRTVLRLTSEETEEAIAFVRFIDDRGALREERRLSIRPGHEARFDLAAYGLYGTFRLEVASMQKVTAALEEAAPRREVSPVPRRGTPRTEDFRE